MSSSAPTSNASGACKTGVLLRAEKTPTGMKGIFLSLDEGEVGGYAVTLDANGKELTRERLRPGGGLMRVAPIGGRAAARRRPPRAALVRAGGAPVRGAAGAGPGAQAGGQRTRRMLPSGATLPDLTEPSALKPNDWNDVDVVIDANIFRPWVNTAANGGGAADDDLGKFGPIAIYVGGSGEVHFRDVSYRDLSLKRIRQGRAVVQLPHAAAHAVLLLVRVGAPRISIATATWTSSRDRSSSWAGFHEGARVLHGALHQPVDELLVQLARVRRRLSPATGGPTCCSRRRRARGCT